MIAADLDTACLRAQPDAVNAALVQLFSAAEAGRWLAHRPA
jgi:hypothetical protein